MMTGARNHDCTIGAAAEHLGLSVDALRYYERVGVIPPAARDASGQRRFYRIHLIIKKLYFILVFRFYCKNIYN